jgi:hypothetical protein
MKRIALKALLLAALAPLASCSTPGTAGEAPVSRDLTRVLDPAGLERLLHNKGLTLQWIDWDRRGTADARMDDGTLLLAGTQTEKDGQGLLSLDGYVEEIGPGYFTFRGTIRISDTPDRGRMCEAHKSWHFAITRNRKYYRLREFEWCDGLTDYIDIYF